MKRTWASENEWSMVKDLREKGDMNEDSGVKQKKGEADSAGCKGETEGGIKGQEPSEETRAGKGSSKQLFLGYGWSDWRALEPWHTCLLQEVLPISGHSQLHGQTQTHPKDCTVGYRKSLR